MIEKTDKLSAERLRAAYVHLYEHIEEKESSLHIFVPETYNLEQILSQIDDIFQRYPDPTCRPSLFGVPIGIKDIFHCKGLPTRCGSSLPSQLFDGNEASTVTRLKNAGAIVLGKTATTEFAYFTPAHTCNPHNVNHTPGGSSSGSAAGVAADFFQYALGTQTVGSITRPASYCGVVGFKPSFGRIATDGLVPFSWTVDHVGVFCKDIQSLEPIVSTLVDNWQPASLSDQRTIGIPTGPYLQQADKTTRKAFDKQVKQIETHGYAFIEIACMDDILQINARHSALIAAEIARVHVTWFKDYKKQYSKATRELIEQGRTISDAKLKDLQLSCLSFRDSITTKMKEHAVQAIICPSTTTEAPLGLETTGSPLMNLPWTHAGMPTVTLPSGECGPNGLPLGLQLVGYFMQDEDIVSLATAIGHIQAQSTIVV